MRLIDWFKNLRWVRAIRLYNSIVQADIKEHEYHAAFKELFAMDGFIVCKHENTTVEKIILRNYHGATMDVQITYCYDCHTTLKDGTTRGIIQLARQICKCCNDTGENCELGDECPRIRKGISDS